MEIRYVRKITSSVITLRLHGKIDSLALLVGVLQPLTTFPQIYLVFSSHDVSQVSLFMWSSYNLSSVVLLAYGLKHRLWPIIVAQILWLIVQSLMIIAFLVYN